MNLDQHLATYRPIFHRTSVTKKKLLILLVILIIIQGTLEAISIRHFAISYQMSLVILFFLVFPPMVFIYYKLFTIARKSRRNKSLEMKKFSIKNVSSCLLAVACLVVLSIPSCAYLGLTINWELRTSIHSDYADLVALWGKTIASMNATFNRLIFYWKNKILRTEGMKIITSLKISRRAES